MYVPAAVIPLKVGVSVVPFVIVDDTGPETNAQTVEATGPSGSEAEAPETVIAEVGKVMA